MLIKLQRWHLKRTMLLLMISYMEIRQTDSIFRGHRYTKSTSTQKRVTLVHTKARHHFRPHRNQRKSTKAYTTPTAPTIATTTPTPMTSITTTPPPPTTTTTTTTPTTPTIPPTTTTTTSTTPTPTTTATMTMIPTPSTQTTTITYESPTTPHADVLSTSATIVTTPTSTYLRSTTETPTAILSPTTTTLHSTSTSVYSTTTARQPTASTVTTTDAPTTTRIIPTTTTNNIPTDTTTTNTDTTTTSTDTTTTSTNTTTYNTPITNSNKSYTISTTTLAVTTTTSSPTTSFALSSTTIQPTPTTQLSMATTTTKTTNKPSSSSFIPRNSKPSKTTTTSTRNSAPRNPNSPTLHPSVASKQPSRGQMGFVGSEQSVIDEEATLSSDDNDPTKQEMDEWFRMEADPSSQLDDIDPDDEDSSRAEEMPPDAEEKEITTPSTAKRRNTAFQSRPTISADANKAPDDHHAVRFDSTSNLDDDLASSDTTLKTSHNSLADLVNRSSEGVNDDSRFPSLQPRTLGASDASNSAGIVRGAELSNGDASGSKENDNKGGITSEENTGVIHSSADNSIGDVYEDDTDDVKGGEGVDLRGGDGVGVRGGEGFNDEEDNAPAKTIDGSRTQMKTGLKPDKQIGNLLGSDQRNLHQTGIYKSGEGELLTKDQCDMECKNNAICRNSSLGHQFCDCRPMFRGKLCQFSVYDKCKDNPCQNEGECLNTAMGGAMDEAGAAGGVASGPTVHDDHSYQGYVPVLFICLCPGGYHGERCELNIPICLPTARKISKCKVDTCRNGGTCVFSKELQHVYCICKDHTFTGVYCQHKNATQDGRLDHDNLEMFKDVVLVVFSSGISVILSVLVTLCFVYFPGSNQEMDGYLVNNDTPDGEGTSTTRYDYPYSSDRYKTSRDGIPTKTGPPLSVVPPANLNKFSSKPAQVFPPQTYQRPAHLAPPSQTTTANTNKAVNNIASTFKLAEPKGIMSPAQRSQNQIRDPFMNHLSTSNTLTPVSKSRLFVTPDNGDIPSPNWQVKHNLGTPTSKSTKPKSGVLKHLASYPQPPTSAIGDFKNPASSAGGGGGGGCGAFKPTPPLAASSLKTPVTSMNPSAIKTSPIAHDFGSQRYNAQRNVAKFPPAQDKNIKNLQRNSQLNYKDFTTIQQPQFFNQKRAQTNRETAYRYSQ